MVRYYSQIHLKMDCTDHPIQLDPIWIVQSILVWLIQGWVVNPWIVVLGLNSNETKY